MPVPTCTLRHDLRNLRTFLSPQSYTQDSCKARSPTHHRHVILYEDSRFNITVARFETVRYAFTGVFGDNKLSFRANLELAQDFTNPKTDNSEDVRGVLRTKRSSNRHPEANNCGVWFGQLVFWCLGVKGERKQSRYRSRAADFRRGTDTIPHREFSTAYLAQRA